MGEDEGGKEHCPEGEEGGSGSLALTVFNLDTLELADGNLDALTGHTLGDLVGLVLDVVIWGQLGENDSEGDDELETVETCARSVPKLGEPIILGKQEVVVPGTFVELELRPRSPLIRGYSPIPNIVEQHFVEGEVN